MFDFLDGLLGLADTATGADGLAKAAGLVNKQTPSSERIIVMVGVLILVFVLAAWVALFFL